MSSTSRATSDINVHARST